MKRTLVLALLIMGTGLVMSRAEPNADGEPKRGRVEGTWEHALDNAPGVRQIKILNQDHFMWVVYDLGSGKALASAGGTYTLDGNTYAEHVEFGNFGGASEVLGKKITFQIKLDGDTWQLSGALADGTKIDEEWKRVK